MAISLLAGRGMRHGGTTWMSREAVWQRRNFTKTKLKFTYMVTLSLNPAPNRTEMKTKKKRQNKTNKFI